MMKKTLHGIKTVTKKLTLCYAQNTKMYTRKVNKCSIAMEGEQTDFYYLTMDFV